jgi:hypothetical protein
MSTKKGPNGRSEAREKRSMSGVDGDGRGGSVESEKEGAGGLGGGDFAVEDMA